MRYVNTLSVKKSFLRYGELFCGPGGLSLGAKLSSVVDVNKIMHKFVHVWANDNDRDSCETYKRNILKNEPNSHMYFEDVQSLNIDQLQKIDVFAYGFPCNDFSVVGERKGVTGKYGPLYTYGLKVLDKFKPIAFVAENVGGLSSANGGQAFIKILDDLSKAGDGYEITAHKYKAEEYGVPQTRHRIIIVGLSKKTKKKFLVPEPTHRSKYIAVKNVLTNIPADAYNNEIPHASSIVIERLQNIKPGENVWMADLPKHLKLNVKQTKLSQIYKRLHPDKPSYTITGSGGGGTHGYHYKFPRPLTNRERARIQTFPDDFEFIGKYGSVRRQIGMAVPPMLAKIIFTSLLNTLYGIPYRSVEQNLDLSNLKSIIE